MTVPTALARRRIAMRLAAAAVLVALVGSPALAQDPGQSLTALDERHHYVATIVTAEIEKFSGVVTRHCGIYTLGGGPDSPPAVGRKEIAKALECVLDAQRRGQASWAIWQVPGVDAILFDGVGASAVSAIHLVQSAGSDGAVTLTPCLKPQVRKDATFACANTSREWSRGDVGSALGRLGKDVRITAGMGLPESMTKVEPAPKGADSSSEANLAAVTHAVGEALRVVHQAVDRSWPRCPRHHDHTLGFREGWWYCDRDAAFIAELGSLWRVVPRARR